ncbi:MAG TPA: hypothetical protein QF549_03720 [Candidatus Saccharimonadaceae bacterium]|nr:hypothetical protein [Candidatus Saccharimonadaceae bacterium]
MGPITIFDKSALQSFSMDESVWFDAFTLGNVTPLFYVETLADLEKSVRGGKTPEEFVGMLSFKVPNNAVPNVHHKHLIESELMTGESTGMDGYGGPVLAGAQPKKNANGTFSIHFDEFPEDAALTRWHNGEFQEIERNIAKEWRTELSRQDNTERMNKVRYIFPATAEISNLQQLKTEIDKFCDSDDIQVIKLTLDLMDVPLQAQKRVLTRWEAEGRPSLAKFVPYTAHVLRVDLLYLHATEMGYISQRATNSVDMAYLYYLPFCQAFVSGDRVHMQTVPLFLSEHQSFISATDMKIALKEMDDYYGGLPEEVRALGVMRIAGYPPAHMHNAITDVWDKTMREDWRKISAEEQEGRFKPREDDKNGRKLVEQINQQYDSAADIDDGTKPPTIDEAQQVFLKRKMYVQKGRWRMISVEQQKEIDEADRKKKE